MSLWHRMRWAPVLIGAVVSAAPARADDFTWDGGAGTNRWGDAANWSPDRVPGPQDNLILTGALPFDASGVATVELGADRKVLQVFGTSDLQDRGRIVIGSAADVAAGRTLTLSRFNLPYSLRELVIASNVSLAGSTFFDVAPRLTFSGVVGDAAGYSLGSDLHLGGATFTAANTYAGPTLADGVVTFSGADGSARNSRSFTVNGLTLDNTAAVNTDRVNDAAPITLNRLAMLSLVGNATTPATERVGDVTLAGHSSGLSVTSPAGAPATLTVRSLARQGHVVGHLLRGDGGRILLQNAPALIGAGGAAGSTRMSVVPFLFEGDRPVTYDAGPDGTVGNADDGGLRGLADAELASYAAAGAGDNVGIVGPQAQPLAGKTINSLRITPGDAGGTISVTGSGVLHVTSGVLAATHGSLSHVEISGFDAIDFGAAEGVLYKAVGDSSGQGVFISSPVTGTGGITVAGPGTFRLLGRHAYTGTTTVATGTLAVDQASGFGLSGGEGVVIESGGTVQASGSFTTDRPFTVRSGSAVAGFVSVDAGTTLTLSGPLTLDGSLRKDGAGTLALGGALRGDRLTQLLVTKGTLLINGPAGASTYTGGIAAGFATTLGGNGTTAAPVQVQGTLAPGDAGAVGTLGTGNLLLTSGATSLFQLGAPDAGDRVDVSGDLTLDGTLLFQRLDGFGPGVYRLFNYTGRLTDRGLTGGLPGTYVWHLDTSVPGQVNLVVVPEPQMMAAVVALAAVAVTRRPTRRRRGERNQ